MRWLDRDKPNSLGALGWRIINDQVTYLTSSSSDAGWSGVGNTGRICDALEQGVTPSFGGGGGSNDAMIRHVRLLSVKDKGFEWLFCDLSRMQKLCLLVAVLADGRKNEWGEAPSNAAICAMLPGYAAELRLKAPHKTVRPENFTNHVAAGRSAFIKRVEQELAGRGITLYE